MSYTVNSMTVGAQSFNFADNPVQKKMQADINYLLAAVATLQKDMNDFTQSCTSISGKRFDNETREYVDQQLNRHVTIHAFREFVEKQAPTLNHLVGTLRGLELTSETTIEVSSTTFQELRISVAGILHQDLRALGLDHHRSTAIQARTEFLKLAKMFAKVAELFHSDNPHSCSGPYYGEKIRGLCMRLHLYLFRGVSMFVEQLSQNRLAISQEGQT